MNTMNDGASVPVEEPGQQLFDPGPVVAGPKARPGSASPRLRRAQRDQVVMRCLTLDALLPEDHRARIVWDYVLGLDLSELYAKILAVEGGQGRAPADPRILLALWLYATIEGVGSARALDRLCEDHVAYQWLAGDVPMNYHTLSDFRTAHPEFLNDLLTKSVATLLAQNLVDLNRVAQDGVRVRASAGASSFRRRPTLEACRRQAQEQVERLQAEVQADPAKAQERQQQAQQRAARERAERVQQALNRLPELEARKKAGEKDQARASTTDPQATVMKMADGGFRPAYNVQFSTDTKSKVIVGVEVAVSGTDAGQLLPMMAQIQQRYDRTPKAVLVDGGNVKHDDWEALSSPECGTTVYAPVPKSRCPDIDEYAPHRRDTPVVTAWRQRMATPEAQTIYKERAATAELVNAHCRNRGLWQLRVRGLAKVKLMVLWFALAHNLTRMAALRTATATAHP